MFLAPVDIHGYILFNIIVISKTGVAKMREGMMDVMICRKLHAAICHIKVTYRMFLKRKNGRNLICCLYLNETSFC